MAWTLVDISTAVSYSNKGCEFVGDILPLTDYVVSAWLHDLISLGDFKHDPWKVLAINEKLEGRPEVSETSSKRESLEE